MPTNYPQRLKQFIHQNRYLAAILETSRNRKRDRLFSDYLDQSIGAASRWKDRDQVRRAAQSQIEHLQSLPEQPAKKGFPSIGPIRAQDLATLSVALSAACHRPISEMEVAAAGRVASLKPEDAGAFTLYLATLWLSNEELIHALRASTHQRIVLHMTCWPRLQRADRSIASFASDTSGSLTHLKLVGTGGRYSFDANEKILGVPSADDYEDLPPKVFQAFAMLALACNPQCVLKLDDDHRLLNSRTLDELLTSAAHASEAVQYGQVHRTTLPSSHHRAWHFGKCRDAAVGSRILEMPTPHKWSAGSAGYILNRPAIWRVLWGSLYYGRWLSEILYEDMALGEVAAKTGIRLVTVPIESAINAVSEY